VTRGCRITGVSDFIHRPDFNNYKKKEQTRRFGDWICFRPQERGDTYSVGSTHVRALEKFLLHFFLLALIDSTWSQVFIQLSVPDKVVQ
jgi:hypothetical protein